MSNSSAGQTILREVVTDTETTGLDHRAGHRVVEVGCVELLDGVPSGRSWHSYFNPERPVPEAAVSVHGLTAGFLSTAPLFKERGHELAGFLKGGRLVCHNASFDLGFLNAEFGRAGLPLLRDALDTLEMARRKLPGRHHTLDALCDHFGVSRLRREKHGALLDAQLLTEVYARLSQSRPLQFALDLAPASEAGRDDAPRRPAPLRQRLTTAEAGAHRRFIADLGAPALWDQYAVSAEAPRRSAGR